MEWQGKAGTGAFQWNRGGWFGGQFGATAWMLVLGVLLLAQSRPVGAWVVLFGALPNALGFWLWTRRHSLAPFPALQTLIATCGLCAAAAWGSVSQADGGGATEFDFSAWVLLLYPGLLVWFFAMERAARRAKSRRDPTSAP